MDWSEGEVRRKLVGESSVGATFARIMAKCRAGAFTQPQVLQPEVVEIEDNEAVTEIIGQENKSVKPRGSVGQSPSSKQSQSARQGSILSYFTSGKSQKQPHIEMSNQVEVVDLEFRDNVFMLPTVPEVKSCVTIERAGGIPNPEVLEPAEAELIDCLFDFDSGYDSPTKPTFGPLPDLDKLVLEPCSKEELEEMMTEARRRYLWPPEEVFEVQAFPVEEHGRGFLKSGQDDSADMFALEQDMSDDMFQDDSEVLCNPKAAEKVAEADFDLNSPEVAMDEVIEEQVCNDQSKGGMFPDVSQDMFAASFDLGSPLVDGERENEICDREEKSPFLPSSPLFDLGSPLHEQVNDKGCVQKPPSPLFDLGSPLLEGEDVQEQKDTALPSSPLFDLGSPLMEDDGEVAQSSAASTPLPGLFPFLKQLVLLFCRLLISV